MCKQIKQIQASLDKDMTFAPTINPKASFCMSVASEDDTEGSNVFRRLSTSRQYIQDVLGQIKAEMEMSECTFQPVIPHSDVVTAK
jgi:hypothetical protein